MRNLNLRGLLAAAVAFLCAASPVLAADNFPVQDANSVARTMRCVDQSGVGTGPYVCVTIIGDNTGAPITPAKDSTLTTLAAAVATAANQVTAQTSLSTIATNTTGAATASAQATGNGSLATIATNTAGLATSAAQATAQTSLSSIVTNTGAGATATNQATGNASLATVATNTGLLGTDAHLTETHAAAGVDAAKAQGVQGITGGKPISTSNLAGIFYQGTTTPLTGAATYTGATRDTGIAAGTAQPYAYFNGFFFADQAGTATIECSNDNAAWTTCATSALTASTPLILTVPVMFRYHRTKLVNGATAEAVLVVNASYTAA